ncbi:21005_t:CDS:2, partial [Rhizophagus irregularis]
MAYSHSFWLLFGSNSIRRAKNITDHCGFEEICGFEKIGGFKEIDKIKVVKGVIDEITEKSKDSEELKDEIESDKDPYYVETGGEGETIAGKVDTIGEEIVDEAA